MTRFFKMSLLVAVFILTGASCSGSVSTNNNVSVGVNVNVNIAPEDIIYGTNMDPAFVEQSRQDCTDKGGTFNECGSACKTGEMCIAACALRCDF